MRVEVYKHVVKETSLKDGVDIGIITKVLRRIISVIGRLSSFFFFYITLLEFSVYKFIHLVIFESK